MIEVNISKLSILISFKTHIIPFFVYVSCTFFTVSPDEGEFTKTKRPINDGPFCFRNEETAGALAPQF
jgi:hypothetical protein